MQLNESLIMVFRERDGRFCGVTHVIRKPHQDLADLVELFLREAGFGNELYIPMRCGGTPFAASAVHRVDVMQMDGGLAWHVVRRERVVATWEVKEV